MFNNEDNLDSSGTENSQPQAQASIVNDEHNVSDNNYSETESQEEVIEITEDLRKKLKIPEKFKTLNDIIKWGSEAEKAKSRAENEKGNLEIKLREHELMLEEINDSLREKEKQGEITEEERLAIIEKFRDDFANDPIKTLEKMFSAFEKRLTMLKEKEKYESQWAEEDRMYHKKYGDKWVEEIRPALAKIASERPYLKSIKEALAIYNYQQQEQEELNKQDAEEKKKQKLYATSEKGSQTIKQYGDIYEKIANAKSSEELEKLTKNIPRAIR